MSLGDVSVLGALCVHGAVGDVGVLGASGDVCVLGAVGVLRGP